MDEAAVERAQDLRDLGGRARQPRDHLGCRETQNRRHVGVVGDGVDGGGIPPRGRKGHNEFAGLRLGRVHGGAFVVTVLGETERLAKAGHALVAAEQLARAKDGEHQVDFGLPRGLFAQDVQPVANLNVLDLAQPPVDVQQHVVERILVGPVVKPEIVIHLGRAHERPDLLTDRGQLAGVECGDVGVLVQQLLQTRYVAVAFGPGHRWDEVVDEGGVCAAFGLGALPRIVDQERVDQREVAERSVGAAGRRHTERLARQPFEVSVLAKVHDGVRAEHGVEPVVGGQIVMAGRQIGVVIDRDRVLAETRVAAGPSARRCPPASRRSRSRRPGRRCGRRTTRPGGGPQCSTMASVSSAGSVANHSRYSLAGTRIGLPASWPSVSQSASWPPRSISAWINASPSPASKPGMSSIAVTVVAHRPQ